MNKDLDMTEKHTRPPVEGEEGYGLYQYLVKQQEEAEKEAYAVHCVNMHTELVEALKCALDILEGIGISENDPNYIKMNNALNKATKEW